MNVAVIGAGASGMAAALQAAWNGAAVTLFERNEKVGRKLLVTGSGRCNLTNDAVAAGKYACADPAWMETLLGSFGVRDVLDMLAAIGIPSHKTSDGWYYPLSESAQSVVEAFASALELAGVTLYTQAWVSEMRPTRKGLAVYFRRAGGEQVNTFEQVIVSTGGLAYPALGSRGEMFPILEELGHTVLPQRPALAPVLANLGSLKPLYGVRLDVGATLWQGAQCLGASMGNLIFTDWGVNGPAVMDLSHLVSARPETALELSLDLLAFFQDQFDALLAQKRNSPMPLKVFLGAFFPPKVVQVYLKYAQMPEETPLNKVPASDLTRLVEKLKNTRLPVNGVRGFKYCQVSAGGVPVDEVEPQTLASLRMPGLFLTGETLDVVGPCGGYNLQYAFSSGALAGRAAAVAGG